MSEGKKEILLGDCLELMKDIPNGSIDMILCDLPYGTTACKWDTIIPFDKLWEQYERIIKPNGAIILFGQEPFSSYLRISNLKIYKYDLIWNKKFASNFAQAKKRPMNIQENICVFYSKQPNYNPQMITRDKPIRATTGSTSSNVSMTANFNLINDKVYTEKYPESILLYPRTLGTDKNKTEHPTQKPIGLFEYLVKTYTNENDLVLDNTAGSGTTAIACLNTNRQFIVMEKEQKYYDIILKRVGDFNKKFETKTLFGNEI
jgi:DNA modification methylase